MGNRVYASAPWYFLYIFLCISRKMNVLMVCLEQVSSITSMATGENSRSQPEETGRPPPEHPPQPVRLVKALQHAEDPVL